MGGAANIAAKKQPIRRCIGCNEHFTKSELIRVVRSPEGEISLDATGKKSGRGAYVCKSVSCLKKARKAKRLESALECVIPETVYSRMEEELAVGK
ncbi:MAG: YlxR family protein [Clostridia bacterium]|nr:YlxR family protein [Clostridia bacterium]